MIKSMAASQGAKLIAACVCPVAATVAVTVGVPKVRQAVHRVTAPRQYALPKTRVRQPIAAPIQSAPIANPAFAAAAAPCIPTFESAAMDAAFSPTEFGSVPILPGFEGPIGPTEANPPSLPGVPEPRSWVQMLIGFGLIGGATRYALRHNRIELPATGQS